MNPFQQQYPPQYPQQQPQYIPPKDHDGEFVGLKIVALLLIVVLWLIALVIPAFDQEFADGIYGWQCLVLGWLSILGSPLAFVAWMANIPFFISFFIYAFSKKKTPLKISFIFSAIAFGLSLAALIVTDVPGSIGHNNESVSVAFGAYVWIASVGLLMVAAFFQWRNAKEQNPPIPFPYQQYYHQNYPPYPQQQYYQNNPYPLQQNYYPPQQNYPPQNPYPPQQNYSPQNPYQPQQNYPLQNPYSPPQNYQPPQNSEEQNHKGMGDNF